MQKERLNIKVWTKPEGFALEVGDAGYLYDSEGQLLEGMIYHIILKGKQHRRGRGVSQLLRSFSDKTKVELQKEIVAMKERGKAKRRELHSGLNYTAD
jgi:hypothetical protein